MNDHDYIGFNPVTWLERLIEVNATSAFHPVARTYIDGRLRELQENVRNLAGEQKPADKPLMASDGKWLCQRCDTYYTPDMGTRDLRCPYCKRR